MKSEIQKLNESRSNTERVEQTMAILISLILFYSVTAVLVLLIELVKSLF